MRTHFILLALIAGLLIAADEPKKVDPKSEADKKEADKKEAEKKEAEKKELEKLQAGLIGLEKQVLDVLQRGQAAGLERYLAPEYSQLGGPGADFMEREEFLKNLVNLHLTGYVADEARMLRLCPEAAVLTYRLRLSGTYRGKDLPPNPLLVSATWVNRGGVWVSVLRQLTPMTMPMEAISAFEVLLTDYAIRYTYRGTEPLTDVQATLTIGLGTGSVTAKRYWATWQPGETKEVPLDFLAVRASTIERIDLSATALLKDRRVLLSATSRR